MAEQQNPTPPISPIPPPPPDSDERSVAELVFDVSERVSSLVREEVQLAKAEIGEKAGKLMRGSVVGIVAGTFAFLALILIMHGVAWLLAEELFDGNVWPGYFVEAALFLLVAGVAGLIAYRSVQAGAPPVPEQAIEEARQIKETLQGEGGPVTTETAAQVEVPR
jgi:uncharacterized membrane protein YqjE